MSKRNVWLLVFLIFLVTYLSENIYSQEAPRYYVNPELGYKVTQPTDWEIEETEEGIVRFYLKDTPVTFLIHGKAKSNKKLDNFTNEYLNNIRKGAEEYHEISRNETSLSGQPALELLGELQNYDISMKLACIFCVKDGFGYSLIALGERSSFNKYKAEFDKLVNSFSFIENFSYQ